MKSPKIKAITKKQWVERPPLTRKAQEAIRCFVRLKTLNTACFDSVVEYTLIADRWPRIDLYQWLSKHGYVWDSKLKRWRLKQ